MNDEQSIRQDDPKGRPPEQQLSPEAEALRIENLKASRGSHHAAGGPAEDLPKPASVKGGT